LNVQSHFHKPEKFTNHDPDSPASRAMKKWDEREGEIIVQNYNLRRLLMGFMVVIVVLSVALVYKSLSSEVMPYVVEVDNVTGQVRNVGTVEEARNYEPGEEVFKYFISQFVKNTREIPLDPVIYKENVKTASKFLTVDATAKLQTMLTTEKVSERFGLQTVQVNVSTVLPMEGGHSFQVRWIEEVFTLGSGERKEIPYSGIFSIKTEISDDEAKLAINPVGLYITDFSWSRDATAINVTN